MRSNIFRVPASQSPRWIVRGGGRVGTVALVLVSLALFLAGSASADLLIGSAGLGAGQYETPRSVAVDTGTGHVYVSDTDNNRIDVFDPDGTFLFAFGWKVNVQHPEEKLQTCNALSGCEKGSSGSGAGQVDHPEDIAVDSGSHDVYVSETENHRVQKFSSEGSFILMVGGEVDRTTHANLCTAVSNDSCGVGKVGGEDGQFLETLSGLRLAVGSGGVVYVADSQKLGSTEEDGFHTRIQRFEPSGVSVGQLILPETVRRVYAFAVDSGGNLYLAYDGNPGVRKFDPAGNPVTSWGENGDVDPTFSIQTIALDPAGDLFVADNMGGVSPEILEYDPSGEQTLVFFGNGTLEHQADSLAFYHDATGDLFATEDRFGAPGAKLVQVALPSPGPLLVPESTKASHVGSVRATLGVTFNPEDAASHAHFQYITKERFEQDGDSFGLGTSETPDSSDSKAVFVNESVQATNVCAAPTESTCLAPNTTYYFRPIATNSAGTVTGEKAEFTTRPPVEIIATWATEVGTDFARLHAEVNPVSIGASAYFQYIPEGVDYRSHGFEKAISVPNPTGPLDFGASEFPVDRATELYPLEPGTTYHYRLIASDPYFLPIVSSEHSFTTFAMSADVGVEGCPVNEAFRSGPSTALPDCRAYEMVSPLEKNNGDIHTLFNVLSYPTSLDQSSTAGSGFTYSSDGAFADPASAPYADQFLAARHERGEAEEGWHSESIDPLGKGSEFLENPYKAFSPDLSSAWLSWISSTSEPAPGPCAPADFTDLYHREATDGAYRALNCGSIKHVDSLNFLPEIEGFSADGTRLVFRADEALATGASAATTVNPSLRPIYQVYESTGAGQLRLVSVLPNGEASNSDSSVGTVGETTSDAYWNYNRFGSLAHAVSEDGTRVFWSVGGRSGPIYLRLNADQSQSKLAAGKCTQPTKACTIAVSETVSPEGAFFQAGNPQATKALFTVLKGGQFKGDLYEFDASTEPATSHLIASGVTGSILGASEDLSRIYFLSEEASSGEQSEGAVQGKPNVYLAQGGTISFVATLSSGGEASDVVNGYGTPTGEPINHAARVSADGNDLVFMSNNLALSERAAGYDNTDAGSGQADAEVYVYDATANSGTGRLRCVSCNPTGARPVGREVIQYPGNNPQAIAARIPLFESQLYQPRYLSDDGRRVFFDSYDALVPGDTNGKEDVYEWETAGTGSCETESPSYVAGSEGCLSLISSGRSPTDSEFLDASATGSDAFFTTDEGLLPQDSGLVDVYDARVDGGFPSPPAPPAACEGETCQGPPTPPLDTTPSSFAFSGPGNSTPILATSKAKAKQKVKPCEKGKVRKKGKCVKKRRPTKHGSAKKRRTGKPSSRSAKHDRGASR